MHQRCRMPAHASTAVCATAPAGVTAAPVRIPATPAHFTTVPARIPATPAHFTAVPATDEAGRAFT